MKKRPLPTARTSVWKAPASMPVGVLLREEAPRRVEPVQAREGVAGLARLPGRIRGAGRRRRPSALRPQAKRCAAPRDVSRRDVVGGALVGELSAAGQRIVHDEARRVGEDGAQHARRRLGPRWRGGTSAGGWPGVRCTRPSAASREGATVAAFAVHMADALEQRRRKNPSPAAAAAMTSSSLPSKPSRRSVARLGRSCGGQHRLRHAEVAHEAHLGEPLARGRARVRRPARRGSCSRRCRG